MSAATADARSCSRLAHGCPQRSSQVNSYLRGRLYAGMAANGITGEVADTIFAQIQVLNAVALSSGTVLWIYVQAEAVDAKACWDAGRNRPDRRVASPAVT